MIDWIFDLLGKLWDGFWNVVAKLGGCLFLAALIATAVAAGAKILTGGYELRTAIFIGAFCSVIKLIINEVAVPLVWEQEKRARAQAKREYDELFRKAGHPDRYDSNRWS